MNSVFAAAARAVTAQAQRVRRIAARGEPRQEVGLPAPGVAVAAVHEQQRRLARTRRGQAAADFEVGLDGSIVCRGGRVRIEAGARMRSSGDVDADARTGGRCGLSRRRFGLRPAIRARPCLARVRRELPPLPAARRRSSTTCGRASDVLVPAGAAVRRHRGAARHRRPRARHARRQRQRPPVHRRLRGHPAVRDAARVRLRVVAALARPQRRSMTLIDCRITNAVKCLPPENKPMPVEVRDLQRRISRPTCARCRPAARCWRSAASRTTRRCARSACAPSALRVRPRRAARVCRAGVALFDSYHCSRYNTNTRTPDARRCSTPSSTPSRATSARTASRMTKVPQRCQVARPRRRPPRRRRRSTRASSSHRCRTGRACTACSTPTGEALYVGKARDLKKRVSSYFQKTGHEPRIAAMMSQVARVETTVDALRGRGAAAREQPHQGARAALQHPLPRRQELSVRLPVAATRFRSCASIAARSIAAHRYFGPFPSAGAVREGIALAAEGVPAAHVREHGVRQSLAAVHAAPDPALHRAVRRAASREAEYARGRAERASLFLQGKTDEVLAQLQAQMDEAAAQRSSSSAPRASATRSRGCSSCSRASSSRAPRPATSTSSPRRSSAGSSRVNVVMIRGGRHVGDRTFFPRHADGGDAGARSCRRSCAQHYVERPVPPTIIAPDAEDDDALAEVLTAQSRRKVEIVAQSRRRAARVARRWRCRTPTLAIRQKLAQKATQEERLAALQEALGLPSTAQRIECFDVSHTMGEAAVASCVIFDRLAMQTSRVPPLQRHAGAGRRRLRGDARGAVAALRAHRRRASIRRPTCW